MDDLPQLLMRLPALGSALLSDDLCELATPADASSMAALLSVAFEEDWTEDRVRRELGPADGVDASYVVKEQGRVVAVASSRHLPDSFPDAGYVHYVAADSARSGRGLGRAVTAAVLKHFAEEGLRAAVLETDDFRLPAIRTYLKLGFVPEYRHEQDQARWSRILPLVLAPQGLAARAADD